MSGLQKKTDHKSSTVRGNSRNADISKSQLPSIYPTKDADVRAVIQEFTKKRKETPYINDVRAALKRKGMDPGPDSVLSEQIDHLEAISGSSRILALRDEHIDAAYTACKTTASIDQIKMEDIHKKIALLEVTVSEKRLPAILGAHKEKHDRSKRLEERRIRRERGEDDTASTPYESMDELQSALRSLGGSGIDLDGYKGPHKYEGEEAKSRKAQEKESRLAVQLKEQLRRVVESLKVQVPLPVLNKKDWDQSILSDIRDTLMEVLHPLLLDSPEDIKELTEAIYPLKEDSIARMAFLGDPTSGHGTEVRKDVMAYRARTRIFAFSAGHPEDRRKAFDKFGPE